MIVRSAATAIALLAAVSAAHADSGEAASLRNTGGNVALDYANAKPKPLPTVRTSPGTQLELLKAAEKLDISGEQLFQPGARGDGTTSPITLPKSRYVAPDEVGAQEYGTANQPYTTSYEKKPKADPYRRAGKLFFKDGADTYVCSASMIKRGVVVTAAHCVSQFGENRFFSGFEYVPAYSGGAAPYGKWDWAWVFAPPKYLKGTDKCSSAGPGVVCESDIAVIVLAPKKSRYAGDSTGWFGFGTGGYSYTPNGQALITQLGYPVSLNNGQEMMRTDSQGSVDSNSVGNTIIGSLQTGGSSGGPWLVNFGFAPTPQGNPFGTDADRNIVVGVTSWGYVNASAVRKQQGASFFKNKNNIGALVNKACNKVPAACQ